MMGHMRSGISLHALKCVWVLMTGRKPEALFALATHGLPVAGFGCSALGAFGEYAWRDGGAGLGVGCQDAGPCVVGPHRLRES